MKRIPRALFSLASFTAVIVIIAFAMLLPSAQSQQQPAAALESFQGTFTLAGDRREHDAMMDAIDRVVDQLNVFIREIARGELRRRIDAEELIRLSIDETTVAIVFDNWSPIRIPLDGRMHRVRGPSGEELRWSMRFEEGRLIERRIASQGERINVLTLSEDEQRLHMQVRISSDQLPDAIRYRLSYRRSG